MLPVQMAHVLAQLNNVKQLMDIVEDVGIICKENYQEQ